MGFKDLASGTIKEQVSDGKRKTTSELLGMPPACCKPHFTLGLFNLDLVDAARLDSPPLPNMGLVKKPAGRKSFGYPQCYAARRARLLCIVGGRRRFYDCPHVSGKLSLSCKWLSFQHSI